MLRDWALAGASAFSLDEDLAAVQVDRLALGLAVRLCVREERASLY